MKCGTSALHQLLGRHPDIAMSEPKELNFFFGPARAGAGSWTRGNWHRGVGWYERHFDARAGVRGESSPGYTSPSHPEVAGRMAADQRRTLRAVLDFLQVEAGRWPSWLEKRRQASDGQRARPSPRLHRQLAEALRDDADRLRDLAGREYPTWSL